jgi:hypothetical protein
MNYGPHAEKFVHMSSNRTVFLQYFPLNSLLAKPQDYRSLGSPMKWCVASFLFVCLPLLQPLCVTLLRNRYTKGYTPEAIKWRLNCASGVLKHVANFTDVMILNEGAHYQFEEKDILRQSISFMFDFFQALQRSADERLHLLLGMETVPTHFATNDGSGLYGHQRGQLFGQARMVSKYHSDCVLKKVARFDKLADDEVGITGSKPAPPPPGFHAFPCVPIKNVTLARWRNDVLNAAAVEAQVPVIERFDLLWKRCDLHARLHDDCLHYNYGKGGAYMINGITSAMHRAITRALEAKKK